MRAVHAPSFRGGFSGACASRTCVRAARARVTRLEDCPAPVLLSPQLCCLQPPDRPTADASLPRAQKMICHAARRPRPPPQRAHFPATPRGAAQPRAGRAPHSARIAAERQSRRARTHGARVANAPRPRRVPAGPAARARAAPAAPGRPPAAACGPAPHPGRATSGARPPTGRRPAGRRPPPKTATQALRPIGAAPVSERTGHPCLSLQPANAGRGALAIANGPPALAALSADLKPRMPGMPQRRRGGGGGARALARVRAPLPPPPPAPCAPPCPIAAARAPAVGAARATRAACARARRGAGTHPRVTWTAQGRPAGPFGPRPAPRRGRHSSGASQRPAPPPTHTELKSPFGRGARAPRPRPRRAGSPFHAGHCGAAAAPLSENHRGGLCRRSRCLHARPSKPTLRTAARPRARGTPAAPDPS